VRRIEPVLGAAEPSAYLHYGGSLDKPTGLKLVHHIFAGHAGDYYRIPDDEPRRNGGDHGVAIPAG